MLKIREKGAFLNFILFCKFEVLAFWVPIASYARPLGLYRAVYYFLDKHFLYTNLHKAILNILHRAILNILHIAVLNILDRASLNTYVT